MKLSTLITLGLMLSFSISKAQKYQPGYAILNDGTRISGLISYYEEDPWLNQRFILLKDSVELINNSNPKTKKYKADDLKFYKVGDRSFDKIHYVDAENLQLKSLGTNNHMMERLAQGKINANRFYSYYKDIELLPSTNEAEINEWRKQNKNELLVGYKILIAKNNETKVKNAFDVDLQKYFEDTPVVLQKYQAGGYGNEPIVVKKGLAAKMIALAKKTAFKPQEADAMVAAFNDYNEKNNPTK